LSSVCQRGSVSKLTTLFYIIYAWHNILCSSPNYAARYMYGTHKSGSPDETLICTELGVVLDGTGCSQSATTDILCSLSEIY